MLKIQEVIEDKDDYILKFKTDDLLEELLKHIEFTNVIQNDKTYLVLLLKKKMSLIKVS